jgi:crotonobetainyl-CoA:carnitine CoA-transferase CaiB-like acyl-CoA transferase
MNLNMQKSAPLKGLKVVELARVLAGPWVGQTLSELGADVIKIEGPKGDETREWGPPFYEKNGKRSAAYFHSCNRGKRSIMLDFKDETDLKNMKALVADADILIENFKVNDLKKFGLDYHNCQQINPRLIYCSITGFGQTGPYAKQPGYDFIIQGMSGIMSLTGEPDGLPQKVGVAYADIVTGLYAVIGIQSALIQRQQTDKGQWLDMALFDSMVGVLANQGMNYLASGSIPIRLGNAHPNIAPYQVVAVANGHVIIAVGNDEQFKRLCSLLGFEQLATDPSFSSNSLRVENRKKLNALLEPELKKWNKTELLASLNKKNVPAGPINNLQEVFEDPQIIARKMVIDTDGIKGVRTPIRFSEAQLEFGNASPHLDEHRDQILRELQSKNSSRKETPE